jgi:hypothetical protein
MVIYCQACRGRLKRVDGEWKHEKSNPANVHDAAPIAATRRLLFDPAVVGLPGYDRALAWLVKAERAAKSPLEAWRIGLYVFDGRIRGVFKYNGDGHNDRAGALFQAPAVPSDAPLRNHPIVKARLAAAAPPRANAKTSAHSSRSSK